MQECEASLGALACEVDEAALHAEEAGFHDLPVGGLPHVAADRETETAAASLLCAVAHGWRARRGVAHAPMAVLQLRAAWLVAQDSCREYCETNGS